MQDNLSKVETNYKIDATQLERLVEWLRKSNRPQSLKSLTRRYIELLKESAGVK
jgi:hypothetical protein